MITIKRAPFFEWNIMHICNYYFVSYAVKRLIGVEYHFFLENFCNYLLQNILSL